MSGASSADWAGVIVGGVTAIVAIATAILALKSYRTRSADERRRAEVQATSDLLSAFDHLGKAPYDPDSKGEFEKLLMRAEALAPESAIVLRYRGLWFEEILGDTESARDKYLSALRVADDPAQLHLDLAGTLDDDVDEKVRHLTAAAGFARTACVANRLLASHYRSSRGGNDLKRAEEAGLEALRYGPKVSDVRSELARTYAAKGDVAKALEHRWGALRTADRSEIAGKLVDLGYAKATLGQTAAERQRGMDMIHEAVGLVYGRDVAPQELLASIAADAALASSGRRADRFARVAIAWARSALSIQPENEHMREILEDMAGVT